MTVKLLRIRRYLVKDVFLNSLPINYNKIYHRLHYWRNAIVYGAVLLKVW